MRVYKKIFGCIMLSVALYTQAWQEQTLKFFSKISSSLMDCIQQNKKVCIGSGLTILGGIFLYKKCINPYMKKREFERKKTTALRTAVFVSNFMQNAYQFHEGFKAYFIQEVDKSQATIIDNNQLYEITYYTTKEYDLNSHHVAGSPSDPRWMLNIKQNNLLKYTIWVSSRVEVQGYGEEAKRISGEINKKYNLLSCL